MSTVATLVVRVAGDMRDAEKAFAGLESAGKGLERAWGGLGSSLSSLGSTLSKSLGGAFGTLQTTAGSALSSVQTGLGKVGDAIAPLTNALPDLARHAGALGPAFASLGPVGAVLAGITGGLVLLGVTAAGIVAGLVALGKSAADAGDRLLVLSQQSGISVEHLSRFEYVAQQTDTSLDKITGSIHKLGVNMATGSEKTASAIGRIGLSLGDLRKQNPEEAFARIVEGLGKVPDAGQRAALGMQIFGKGFHDVSQLTQEDMRGLMAEADKFGATLSTELAVAGDRFNDTLGQLSTMFGGLKRTIGEAVLPVMTALAEAFRDELTGAMAASGASAADLAEIFTTVAVRIGQAMAAIIAAIARATGVLVEFFSGTILRQAPLLQMIERTIDTLRILASIDFSEGPTRTLANIARAGAALATIDKELKVDEWLGRVKTFSSGLSSAADHIATAADKIGAGLPARVLAIQAEIKKMADAMRDGAGVMKPFGAALAGTGDEADKAAKKLAALVRSLSGQDALESADQFRTALALLAKEGLGPTTEGAARAAKAIDEAADVFRKAGQTVPPWMGTLWASLQPPPRIISDLRNFGHLFKESITGPIPLIANDVQASVDQMFAGIRWENFPDQGSEAMFRSLKWKTAIAEWCRTLTEGVARTVADMLVGLRSFEDGFRDMWRGVQDFASQILNDVLGSFVKKFTDKIADALMNIDFSKLGAGGAAAGIAAGGAVGAAVGFGFGKSFGKTAGIAAGAASGAAVGMLVGGPWGAAAGAAIGGIAGFFGGRAKEKEQQEAIAQTRAEMERTFGSVTKIREAATRLGVSFSDLWSTKEPEAFGKALEKLNKGLEREKTLVDTLNKSLAEVSRSGALLSKDLAKTMQAAITVPGGQEGVFAFMQQQAAAAGQGLETFLANTNVKTKAGVLAISSSLVGLYDELIRQGARPSEAFAQLEPAIARFQQQLAAAGITAPAVFQPLADLARLSADAIGGPLLDAMTGLGDAMVSMHNLGLLNQETFSGFAAEIHAGFKALEAMGQGGIVAVQGMRGPLQKLWELQKDFGYTVTEDEQKLLDFAEAGGVIGDKFRPAADRMVSAIDALIRRLDTFLGRIFDLPAAAGTAASGIENELGAISIPPVLIPYRFEPQNELPGGGGDIVVRAPAMASGGIVRHPTLALIGEKGPEAVVPLHKDFGTDTTATIYLDAEVLTRAVLRKQGRVMRSYGLAR